MSDNDSPTTHRARDAALRVLTASYSLDHLAEAYHPEAGLLLRGGAGLTWEQVADPAAESLAFHAEQLRANLQSLRSALADQHVASRLAGANASAAQGGGHSGGSFAEVAGLIGRERYDRILYVAAPETWADWVRQEDAQLPTAPRERLLKCAHAALRMLGKCRSFDYKRAKEGVKKEAAGGRAASRAARLHTHDRQIIAAITDLEQRGVQYPSIEQIYRSIGRLSLDVVTQRTRAMYEHYLLDRGPGGAGYTVGWRSL